MRRVKLRAVIAWMALVLLGAMSLLCLVWKQHEYARLARALDEGEKQRTQLQSGLMLLETEVRALRQPARLEAMARGRFGLIDPGPPIAVRSEGGSAWRANGW